MVRKQSNPRIPPFVRLLSFALLLCMVACESPDHEKSAQAREKESSAVAHGYLGMSLPAGFTVFGTDSPWNTPVASHPAIDPYSDLMISNLAFEAKKLQWAMERWSIPLHVIDSRRSSKADVRTKSAYINPIVDPDGDGIAEGIPIPDGVWADPEEDGHMLLVDPTVRRTWDFSSAAQDETGTWRASMIDVWDLDGPGFRPYNPGERWWATGARGAGVPLLGGLIRPEEIKAGEIRHALACATPVNRYTTYHGGRLHFCSPVAARSDGNRTGLQYIPEGARLQLDPTLDLDGLQLSREVVVIARAMQQYGMYVVDNSAIFKIYFQNLGQDAKEWKTFPFGDVEKIPISSFRVLECNMVEKE